MVLVFIAFTSANLFSQNFRGKTVEWVIPFSAGGGSDRWARFYAPLLAEALPGRPNVVVRNIPGGGSTKGANFFAQRAKADGLTILGTSGSTQFPYLLGDKRVRYEYKDWNIVLGSPTGGVVYVSTKLGINSAKDILKLKGKGLKYGSQGATSLDLVPLLAFEILGLDVKAVFGMKGRKDGRLAFQRGETTIDYQTSSSYIKNVLPEVEKGNAVALFSFGSVNDQGELVRDDTFPDLPHFAEVYEMVNGREPSGDAFNAWKTFFIAGFPAQKMVFLPKGTNSRIVRAYTEAFNKVINTPGFQPKKDKALGKYRQVTGNSAKNLLRGAINVDASSERWVKNWLKDKYNANL